MEEDEEWRGNIREKRFEACNREWLDFLANGPCVGVGERELPSTYRPPPSSLLSIIKYVFCAMFPEF